MESKEKNGAQMRPRISRRGSNKFQMDITIKSGTVKATQSCMYGAALIRI